MQPLQIQWQRQWQRREQRRWKWYRRRQWQRQGTRTREVQLGGAHLWNNQLADRCNHCTIPFRFSNNHWRHNVHHNHCRAVTVCRKVTFATNHPQCGFHTQLLQRLHKGFGAKGKAFVFQAWFHFWNWTCPYLGGRRSHKKWEQSLEIILTLARINQSLDRIG